jgi:uncharacterized protein (TIGR03435 family)
VTERIGHDDRKLLMIVASRIAVLMPMMFLLAGMPLRGQVVMSPATLAQQPAEPPAASFTFDVVTIKLSGSSSYGPGPYFKTGYSSIRTPLYWTIFQAYFSSPFKGNQIIGLPAWAFDDPYDINARIDEADIPAWMNLTYAQRVQPRHRLLQQMLLERCKLVAHLVPAEVDGFVLVVGKGGAHLTSTKPGETYPAGAKGTMSDGPKVVPSSPDNNMTESYFNATMEDFTQRLSWAWPIIDHTNLTGRYDFTFRRLEIPKGADGQRISNPEPYDLWDISGTGLEIKRAKIPTQNLVIDHIERPSPN